MKGLDTIFVYTVAFISFILFVPELNYSNMLKTSITAVVMKNIYFQVVVFIRNLERLGNLHQKVNRMMSMMDIMHTVLVIIKSTNINTQRNPRTRKLMYIILCIHACTGIYIYCIWKMLSQPFLLSVARGEIVELPIF